MRQILMILFTLITCTASAQLYQRMPQYGYEMDRGRILLDLDIPTDTTTNKSGVVRIGATLYAGNGSYWTAAATGTFDTSGIRIRPIPGTYMTITGTYPNLTFNVIYDSTVLQTKFRSDTNRTNVYTTLDTIIKYVSSPDGSVGITSSGRNIYFTVTGAPNSASPGNYIITYPTIERSNDTVDVIPNIVFQQGALRDTITTGAQYVVPYASADQKRIDHIFINPSGLLDTAQGVEDSFFAVRPDLPAGSIPVADINVYGTDSIVVSNVGLFQKTAGVFIGDDSKLKTDSANYYYQEAMRRLTAGSFRSTVVGGVALYMGNGSDIRSDERMYLTSASTMMFRTNGFGKRMAIYPSGNVGIGGPDTDVPSAILNLFDTTSKGFLPPVMRGVRMNAISSPATGLMLFNTTDSSYYFYNGAAWVKWSSGGSGTSGWGLTGNAGTNSTTDFIGTTDAQDLFIKLNGNRIAKFSYATLGTAFGSNSNATGINSFAAGSNGFASGLASISVGNSNTASGSYSFASGLSNISDAYASASFNEGNYARGDYSFAAGNGTRARSKYSVAIGRYNDTADVRNDTIRLFSIGNGITNGTRRGNIFTATINGIGINTTTPDSALHVIGGVAMPNLYESSDVTDSMVVKNADGGLGIRAIPGGGSGTTPLYFDHIGSGQSNMAGRDATIGDWVYTKNDRTQSFNSSNLFVTADPALNNICYSDGAVTAERNNTAWQFSLNYAKDNLTDTVRLICEAVGSMSSWEWTPETTGDGEQTTSNTRLTALITKLDAAPSNYKAKLITMQYGENDAVTGNLIYFLNNVVKFYDTLRRHPKCDTNIVMQLVYPITNQPINGDSLRRCLDSIYYRTKDIGNRFITAVPHTYPGTASGHPSNDTTDLIGRLCYSNYLQGFGNGPIKPDSSYWKRSLSPEFVYTPERVVVGSASPISSSYIQNVIVNGTSTLAYFGRSNSGSDGNQQALTIITNSAGNTGSLLMHRSEKSGSVVDRNGWGFRDSSIVALDSNQASLGFLIGNNGVQISKPISMSSNSLATGNFLLTTSTQPLRIFNTTTTGLQLIVSNNSTSAGSYSSIRFRSGSVGTYDLADLRTIVNAAGDGGHHAIFTRKSSGLAETIRFTDSNRVGIGTTTPTVRLSVVGDGTNAAAFTSGNVGIGTASPAASAALDITSTTQGVLMPRMTATQGSAISSPADALLIYVTDTNGTFTSIGFWGRENGVWVKL